MTRRLEIVPVGDELAVVFPDEFVQCAGWKVGDMLDFEVKERSILLRKRRNQREAGPA